jgi:menaquinone-dependent protoporphyrinogen oxidase
MKTAILYFSKHGTTEKVAQAIADKLRETSEVELFSLRKNPTPNVGEFDRVVLGSSVYMGQSSKTMKAFCKQNESDLLQKKIGLFICGMHPNKAEQEKELREAYPQVLQENAAAIDFLGGEFLFESMNFFERFIARMIAKTKTSVHQINWNGIDDFVKKLQ